VLCALLPALIAVGLTGATSSAANGRRPLANAAGTVNANAAATVNVKDEGHLHLVDSSGSELAEEGPVSGTIPGKVKVSFNIGATITAKFTIYAKSGGSINGHGGGSLHSTSTISSFGGSLTVTGGSGRYAHAHGSGKLYGSINRKTDALTVTTVGELHY
jgi:hypothetical protein